SDGRLTTSRRYVKWRRSTGTSRRGVDVFVLRLCATSLCYVFVLRLCATPLLDAFWLLIPPPHAWQGTGARPDLVQRLAFIQPAVLHDVANLLGVVDVVERVRVQHHEIAELAGLERAQLPVHPDAA